MKKTSIGVLTQFLALASSLAFSAGASAASSWNSISAFSSTGGTSAQTFECAKVQNYGTAGYGIVNKVEKSSGTSCSDYNTNPIQHAADNFTHTDMFLIGFAQSMTLSEFKIGWNGSDDVSNGGSDISVLRYTGTSDPSSTINGKTVTQLLNNWEVIGNYANVGSTDTNAKTTGTDKSSSWWLISAYNSGFGSNLSVGNDYFKLLSVAGNVTPPTNQTPEPGSLALAGLGLIGVLALRRRRRAN